MDSKIVKSNNIWTDFEILKNFKNVSAGIVEESKIENNTIQSIFKMYRKAYLKLKYTNNG